jgi:hypothetical protein
MFWLNSIDPAVSAALKTFSGVTQVKVEGHASILAATAQHHAVFNPDVPRLKPLLSMRSFAGSKPAASTVDPKSLVASSNVAEVIGR